VLSLPMGPAMDAGNVQYVLDALEKYYN